MLTCRTLWELPSCSSPEGNGTSMYKYTVGVAECPEYGCTAWTGELGVKSGTCNFSLTWFWWEVRNRRFHVSAQAWQMRRNYRAKIYSDIYYIQNLSMCPPDTNLLLSSSLLAMPTFIFWKTLSLTVLTLQTVTGDSNLLNIDSSFSVNPPDESGLVGSPMADGSNNEPWQQVPDLQSDPNLLIANERDCCASPSNQIQTPRRRRSRLKREETMCASGLNRNTKSTPNGQQSAPNGDRTGSTPKLEMNADPLKNPSRWLDLPKDPKTCGVETGLAKLPVCHPGVPRLESPAWWLENIRPGK